jgi:hypothetical protein
MIFSVASSPASRSSASCSYFFLVASWLLGSAKFACLQRQKPATFAQMPLFVYRHFTGCLHDVI